MVTLPARRSGVRADGGFDVERGYAIGKGAIYLQIRRLLPGGLWKQEVFELKTRGPHDGDPLEERGWSSSAATWRR